MVKLPKLQEEFLESDRGPHGQSDRHIAYLVGREPVEGLCDAGRRWELERTAGLSE